MKCPKCNSDFKQLNTPFGDVERCLQCKGLWLDMLEHEDLMDIADGVDVGDPEIGKKYNEIGHISCPVCPNSKMLRMVDAKQTHIWFESCPTCYGRFYDAGEFKDLSEYTISDFIKKFTAKERK
ncbi:MAG: zf-TFIIB domain-containing protein [Cellvibrionaceae bacterium]